MTQEQVRKIATSHQRQMCSVDPYAIIETIMDAINEALHKEIELSPKTTEK